MPWTDLELLRSLNTCASISELPSNISTMFPAFFHLVLCTYITRFIQNKVSLVQSSLGLIIKVLILHGNLEIGVLVWSDLCYLVYLEAFVYIENILKSDIFTDIRTQHVLSYHLIYTIIYPNEFIFSLLNSLNINHY